MGEANLVDNWGWCLLLGQCRIVPDRCRGVTALHRCLDADIVRLRDGVRSNICYPVLMGVDSSIGCMQHTWLVTAPGSVHAASRQVKSSQSSRTYCTSIELQTVQEAHQHQGMHDLHGANLVGGWCWCQLLGQCRLECVRCRVVKYTAPIPEC